jgi:dTDP-4-dehydrorhamnose 3,5-epimerase
VIVSSTPIYGAWLIDLDRKEDERGWFARTWCRRESEAHALNVDWVQYNLSFNRRKGTLRGMHYQAAPHGEAKLVRCISGSIHDVIVDLRTHSPTYRQIFGTLLTSENRRSLFIPEGCAHGFLTLEENTEVFYHMSQFFVPEAARGFRWNDPFFHIEWPDEIHVISERDRMYPDFALPS